MQANELTELIRQRAQHVSSDQTNAAVNAVFSVLGSRDLGGEAANLAAQLPQGFNDTLGTQKGQAEHFDAAEFLDRIAQHLDLDQQQAEDTARAVLSSITEAVTEGQRTSFLNALPTDFSDLTHWSA